MQRYLEKIIVKYFAGESAINISKNVFSYFGKNMNAGILFSVWKQRKFEYIAYPKKDDYEIPESVLTSNILEIGKPELERILKFSFGEAFCSMFVDQKFSNIKQLNSVKIKELYEYLQFETENKREKRELELGNSYFQQVIVELIEETNKLGVIKNNDDFNTYYQLLRSLPIEFTEKAKDKTKNIINQIIVQKCSDEFKPELWVKGLIEEIPFEIISNFFLDKDTQTHKRMAILSKLPTEKQFELLKLYANKYNFEGVFNLIELFVQKENALVYSFNFSRNLFNADFWIGKKYGDLVKLFNEYTDNKTNEEQKYELFFKGYIKDVPQNVVHKNIRELTESAFIKIFQSLPKNSLFIKEISTSAKLLGFKRAKIYVQLFTNIS